MRKGDFKKGHTPWNKGMKGIHLSPKSEFKKGEHPSPKTEFKKGKNPWNTGTKGICKPSRTSFKKGQSPWNKGKEYLAIRNEKHPNWKGEEVGYGCLHTWVRKYLGEIQECNRCGAIKSKSFHWHNTDGEYKRNLKDWERLCVKCHNNEHKSWLKRRWRKCAV